MRGAGCSGRVQRSIDRPKLNRMLYDPTYCFKNSPVSLPLNSMLWPFSKSKRRAQNEARPTESCVPGEFTPITHFSDQDVFIVGYPKSGNTWFQDLASGVVFGLLPELASPDLVQDLVPDVHFKSHYKRYVTPTFFKSHALPSPAYRKVVYLLRDGRDAMVSYHHMSEALGGRIEFLDMVRTGNGIFPSKWHEHVQAWLANPFNAQMIVLRYEDLLKDTATELQRFCNFVGVQRTPEFIKMIADGTKFQKMQEKEIRMGVGDDKWPRDKLFRRRGAAGSYKDEMPPDVLEAFMQEAGETLHKMGYA